MNFTLFEEYKMTKLEQRVLDYFRTFHTNSSPNLDRIYRDLKFQIPELRKTYLKTSLLNLLTNKYLTVSDGKYTLIDTYQTIYKERLYNRTPVNFFLNEGIYNHLKNLAQQNGVTIQTYIEKIVAEYINSEK